MKLCIIDRLREADVVQEEDQADCRNPLCHFGNNHLFASSTDFSGLLSRVFDLIVALSALLAAGQVAHGQTWSVAHGRESSGFQEHSHWDLSDWPTANQDAIRRPDVFSRPQNPGV